MISLIITTYNRVELLKRAIKSVQRQTFKDYELIIIDDGSTDGTQDFCKDIDATYIRLEKNSGNPSVPRNIGTKIAKYPLIAYLDDDNEFLDNHLEVLYNGLDDNDIVYGDREIVDDIGGKKIKPVQNDFEYSYKENEEIKECES